MPLYAIGSVLIVFLVCTTIDQLRIRVFEKPFLRFYDTHSVYILNKYKRIEKIVMNRMN